MPMPTYSRLNVILKWAVVGLLACPAPLRAQQKTLAEPGTDLDSDHDGLSDALEQRLLQQFEPTFMVGEHDCSTSPAEFKAGMLTPKVMADNGTIYGQVFPAKQAGDQAMFAEIHFYHLWRKDCGEHGHPLDTEHVAVLVRASDTHLASATWKATYWYAAAHENTVCDVSQIARASILGAVDHGATAWISPGKHASYLNEELCQRGCSADRCENMVALTPAHLINLGEPGKPMNDSAFISSSAWPLLTKMSSSNFPPAPVARLNALPATDIAWFRPGRHPAQGIIARSSVTEKALAGSGRDTTSAISLADESTLGALSASENATTGGVAAAGKATGNALQKSYRTTRHALDRSAHHVGEAVHVAAKSVAPLQQQR